MSREHWNQLEQSVCRTVLFLYNESCCSYKGTGPRTRENLVENKCGDM